MSSCNHSSVIETACRDPGSEFCGIQKTFSSTSVVSRSDKACPNCKVKLDAVTKPKGAPEGADAKVQVSEKAKVTVPQPLSFLPPTVESGFTFTPPPFTPTKTTKTQRDVEEKWKTLEDTIRWDALLTDTEKLGQSKYRGLSSPTQFRFKLS